jgi:NADPH-dependent 2,4-dienoyl-CoA reductase/sulfur reductase-like enzyme
VLLAAVCRAQERYVEAPARTVPVIDRVDVVVVGGNEGGMAAAWSAARQGARSCCSTRPRFWAAK